MRFYLRLTFISFLLLASKLYATTVPYESWMGTYVGPQKIGSACLRIDRTEINGVRGYRLENFLSNRMKLMGADMSQQISSVVFVDSSYSPIKENFSITSAGKTTSVEAFYEKDSVNCIINAENSESCKRIPIPDGAKIVSDSTFGVRDIKLAVGNERMFYIFNPLTLSLDRFQMKVVGKEKIKVDDIEYDTFEVKSSTDLGDTVVWQTNDGEVIKVKALMGITMMKENMLKAIEKPDKNNQQDFAELTNVKVNRVIKNPRNTKFLKVYLKGISDTKMTISDARQKSELLKKESDTAEFIINIKSFDYIKSVDYPIIDLKLKPFLETTPYLDCVSKNVIDQAKLIAGNEKNAYRTCSLIRQWLFANMETRTNIGITRCSSDVLKSSSGVCRDYAILFASFARSLGIPAKVVSGLIYSNDAFYYHAWTECFVGEWIAFDGTLPYDYVDATHIKLAEGDATTMFSLAKVIGSLKADIKEYR